MAQYQDGDRRFGMVRRNGVWVSDDQQDAPSAAPSAPRPWVSAPREPTPQTGAQATLDQYQAQAGQYAAPTAAANMRRAQAEADIATRKARDGDPADPSSISVPGNIQLTGDDYLKTVPRNLATQVKALADGRMSPPTGRGAAAPYWQRLFQMTAQYDPSFDAINYGARAATRRDFTSGTSARNVKSLNTALGHLGTLADQIEGTASHGGFPFATSINSIENSWNRGSGDSGVTTYEQTAGALASELTAVFRGAGGAEADIARSLKELDANASGEQKHAAIGNIAALLRSRLEAVGDQYTQGMGKSSDPLSLLNPHAKKVLQMYGGLADDSGPPQVGPGAPPAGGGQPPRGPLGNDPLIYGQLGDASGNQSSLASGASRTEYDGRVAGAVNQMIRMGRPDAEINAYLKSEHASPATNLDAARAYLRQHPGYKGNFVEATREVPTTAWQRASASAPAAAVGGAANAITMGFQDEIAGLGSKLTGGDYTQGRDAFNARKHLLADSHPTANLLGNVAGGVAGTLGGEALLGRLAPGALRAASGALGKYAPLASDAAYGSAYGAGEDNQNRLGGAVGGALTAAAGGAAVRGATRGVGAAIAPSGGDMAPLYELGAYPTLGQRMSSKGLGGRMVNSTEQLLQSIPGLGVMVSRARDIPRQQAQRGLFNDTLKELDPQLFRGVPNKLPDGMPLGTQPHAFAVDAFRKAYNQARGGMQFKVDGGYLQTDLPKFVASLHDGTLDATQAAQVQTRIQTAVGSRLQRAKGALSGEQYKAAAAALEATAAKWGKNPNTAMQADALRDYIGIFDAAARRNSAPASVARLDAADRGYAKLVRIQHASEMAGGEPAQFTPAQYRRAVQKDGGGVRSSAYLQGDALGQRFSNAMRGLEDTIPNSGSAERLMAGQAVAGGTGAGLGALGVPMMAAAKPGAALLAPYVPGANFLTTRAMAPRSTMPLPPKALAALEDVRKQLNKRTRMFGRFGAIGTLGYNEP